MLKSLTLVVDWKIQHCWILLQMWTGVTSTKNHTCLLLLIFSIFASARSARLQTFNRILCQHVSFSSIPAQHICIKANLQQPFLPNFPNTVRSRLSSPFSREWHQRLSTWRPNILWHLCRDLLCIWMYRYRWFLLPCCAFGMCFASFRLVIFHTLVTFSELIKAGLLFHFGLGSNWHTAVHSM